MAPPWRTGRGTPSRAAAARCFPPAPRAAAEALARSVEGTLFFAGEATAGARAGTVDGAIMTGERAAREVLASR